MPALSQHQAIALPASVVLHSLLSQGVDPDLHEEGEDDGIEGAWNIEVHSHWRKWYLDRKY